MYQVSPASSPRFSSHLRSGPVLFGLIFGGIGLLFAFIGGGMLWQYWRAARWPTADGVVLTSKVDSQRGSKGGSTYACLVTYRFSVNGREYTGSKLEPMTVYASGSGAHEDHAAFAAGTKCTVYYDPADPGADSCLRPSAGIFQWIFFLVGALFAAIGVSVMVGSWWARGGPLSAG
jgi:hypothetical protein